METKEELVNCVKNWIALDNEIREHRAYIKNKVAAQKQISADLLEVMKKNEIDNLNTNEMRLTRVQKTTKHPMSKKYLENILLKYYDNNSQKASEVQEYIMENRITTTKDTLKTKRVG